MKKWMALLVSVLALGLVGIGCGDDDDDGGGEGAQTTEQPAETAPAEETDTATAPTEGAGALEVTASDTEVDWDPKELSASAGEITLTLNNPSTQIPHNIVLEDVDNGASETVTDDETSVTVELEPGEYTYFCAVGNHRQQGMEGTLTVE